MTSTISAMGFRGSGKLVAGGSQLTSPLAVEPIGFLRIGAHGLGLDLRRHLAFAQPDKHAAFQSLAVYVAGVSQPLLSTLLVQE